MVRQSDFALSKLFGGIRRVKPTTITGLLLLLGVASCYFVSYRPVWQFNHLEQNARKVVTASELQTWATNLLSRNPTGTNLVPSNWGSDFPAKLNGLCPKIGPSVCVYEPFEANGEKYPGWVRVMWSSGMLGASGFELGPTNFISMQPGHAWAPGVYFFKR